MVYFYLLNRSILTVHCKEEIPPEKIKEIKVNGTSPCLISNTNTKTTVENKIMFNIKLILNDYMTRNIILEIKNKLY